MGKKKIGIWGYMGVGKKGAVEKGRGRLRCIQEAKKGGQGVMCGRKSAKTWYNNSKINEKRR